MYLGFIVWNNMVTKIMIAAAVPFYTVRLQTNVSRNVLRKVAGAEKLEINEENKASKQRRKRLNLSFKEKIEVR